MRQTSGRIFTGTSPACSRGDFDRRNQRGRQPRQPLPAGRRSYLTSAGPRQPCVWGSRVRPLPQPPMTSCAERFGAERLATDTLGQGPCSRKVPFAFASSTAIVESDTTIAAHMIEGLLMGSFPAGQPSPNRNLRPLADADLTANQTDSQFARAKPIFGSCLRHLSSAFPPREPRFPPARLFDGVHRAVGHPLRGREKFREKR